MLSGCIEVMIMHPLDLIKTRFQLQNSSLAGAQYTGVRDCARKMYAQVVDNSRLCWYIFISFLKQEGLFSFWKGLLPPILVETPKRAWKFFTFEQFQKVFLFGSDKPSALVSTVYFTPLHTAHFKSYSFFYSLDIFSCWPGLWGNRGHHCESL